MRELSLAGAPNEDIVQNSTVARILVFKWQIQAYFYPLNFLSVRISQLKVQRSENYRDQNLLTFSKISARKRLPKILDGLFQGKNPLKMGDYTIFQMFENPRRGRQVRNFTTNVPKILDVKSSSEQIFSENCRWVPLSLGRPKGGCMCPHNRGGHLNRGLISYSSLQFRTWITCHFICDCLMMVQLYLHLLLCNIHDCKL